MIDQNTWILLVCELYIHGVKIEPSLVLEHHKSPDPEHWDMGGES